MIELTDKHDCCGCSACINICPKYCISFLEDEQGFLYPSVENDLCINCGKCNSVCPVICQDSNHYPLSIFAAVNCDEKVRLASSSGGVFSALAEFVIKAGGVVFGACYDDKWEVVHKYADKLDDIQIFRGSKYLQSRIGNSFVKVRDFLKQNRTVLFSGTPCQISGLRKFLSKSYDNLILVDIVCHGVPSFKVWNSYLEYLNPNNDEITHINLRDKSRGWSRYSYVIKNDSKTFYDDYAANSLYLQGFSANYYLRPSCYKCPVKCGKSGSDLTLADNWGSEISSSEFCDNKGVSAVLINTEKGNSFFEKLSLKKREITFDTFLSNNRSYEISPVETEATKLFWAKYKHYGIEAVSIVKKKMRPGLFKRFINKTIKIVGK